MNNLRTLLIALACYLGVAGFSVLAQNGTQVVNSIIATTCAANQWASTVASTGAATCTQPSTSNLSDVANKTTWSPADNSGASLALTNNSSASWQHGKVWNAYLDVTYPSTANSANAAVALPVNMVITTNSRTGGVSFPIKGTAAFFCTNTGSNQLNVFTTAQCTTAVTNVTLSTLRISSWITFATD